MLTEEIYELSWWYMAVIGSPPYPFTGLDFPFAS